MRFLCAILIAATLAAHADDSAKALLARGAAHEEAGRLAEAARDYDAARVAAEKAGDRERAAEALILLGYLQYYRGEMNDALVHLRRGYDIARELGDAGGQRTALAYIAHVYADSKVGQYDRAIEYYQQLLPQYEAANAKTSVADTLFNLGSTYERKEDLESALTWYRRALAAEEKLGRAEEVAFVKRAIGSTLGKLGRPEEGLPLLEDAVRATPANSDRFMMMLQTRGILHRRAGHVPEAMRDLEASRAYYEKSGNTRYLEKSEEELALVYATAGRWHDAYEARTRHTALQRELAEKMREEHTSRLRVQFDTEKKEQENRALLRDQAAAARIRRLQTIILILSGAIILVLAYLMVRLARDKRRMRIMAMTDELTRLPNRRHLLALAQQELQRGEPFSLLAFDIDHFKRINDTWGHAAGDAVLQRVSHACRMALRPSDHLGRTGGEEFTAVLPSTTERDAILVADRLRAAVEALDCRAVDPALRVTISIGVAEWCDGETLDQLAARADERLYDAKKSGRNRVVAAAVA